MRGGRAVAIRLGLTVFAAALLPAAYPAPAELLPELPTFPTYRPEGGLLFSFPFPLPSVLPRPEPEAVPGAPEAPECPSGVAANEPRRLPCGGTAGAPTVG